MTEAEFVAMKKPRGFWLQKENAILAASFCKTVPELKRRFPSARGPAQRLGWWDEITAELKPGRVHNGHYTKLLCATVAQEYQDYSIFRTAERKVWEAAWTEGWLEEICAHMARNKAPNGYWQSLDRCKDEALKYQKATAMSEGSPGAYSAAQNNGWLDLIGDHWPEPFTLAECRISALKFQTQRDWRSKEKRYFERAKNKGWVNQLTKHMRRLRVPNGFWTTDTVKPFVDQCEFQQDLRDLNPQAYMGASRGGFLQDLIGHLPKRPNAQPKWPIEVCRPLAAVCQTKKEFRLRFPEAHTSAQRLGWLSDIGSHFVSIRKPASFYTFDECSNHAKSFKTRAEWQYAPGSHYKYAEKNGWLDRCVAHMEWGGPTDNNAIYIWFCVEFECFKIGVTSQRLGRTRIDYVARDAELTAELVILASVENAAKIETALKARFERADVGDFSGSTEFRYLSTDDLEKAILEIESVASSWIRGDWVAAQRS